MYKTPYETLACRLTPTKETVLAIKKAYVNNELRHPNSPDGNIMERVLTVLPGNDEVPVFSFPLLVELNDQDVVVFDLRPYAKLERDGEIKISNASDYQFKLVSALLNDVWVKSPEDLLLLGDLPIIVFVRWLTNNITSALGLGPEDQVVLSTIVATYYYSLFKEDSLTEKDRLIIVKKVSSISFIPTEKALAIVDKLDYIDGLSTLVDVIKESIQSPRINNLNVGLLITMLNKSWFGFDAKTTIAVALEHPPTFLSMIQSSLESRSFRKSYIGTLVYQNDKKGLGNVFTKSLLNIIS